MLLDHLSECGAWFQVLKGEMCWVMGQLLAFTVVL
jgi:hypothetical protein